VSPERGHPGVGPEKAAGSADVEEEARREAERTAREKDVLEHRLRHSSASRVVDPFDPEIHALRHATFWVRRAKPKSADAAARFSITTA